MRGLVLLLIAVALGALGQIALKSGIEEGKRLHHLFPAEGGSVLLDIFRSFLVPKVAVGFLLYAVSSGFWLAVLSVWKLSYAYPLVSIGYILVALLSWWLLAEPIPLLRWAGILIICVGVALVGMSNFERSASRQPVVSPQAAPWSPPARK